MSNDMKFGYALAMQGVKEKIDTILSELCDKGYDEPVGFSVLKGYIRDCIRENEANS